MNKIVDDAQTAAKWIAKALISSGYNADFSVESLKEIDRFFDEHGQMGVATPGGLLANDLGKRLFALGAYVGEVILQKLNGTWVGDDADPRAEINIELRLPDGTRAWPVQRVMKRFKNGSADGVAVYGRALGAVDTQK